MTLGNKKKHHALKRGLNYSLSFLLSGVFLYIAFQGVNINDVIAKISKASLFWIAIFLLVNLFSHFLRAIRWKVILHSVKPDTSIKNLFGALMVGYGVNCVIPRFGEISRAVLVGKWERLSRSSMFGAVIVERFIDMIFLGLSIYISVLIWTDNLYDKIPWLKSTLYITSVLLVSILVFLFLVIKYKKKFYGIIVKFLSRFNEKIAHKVGYIFDMLTEGFNSLKGTKNYLYTIGLSVLIMLVYALNSYVGFFTVGMENIKPVTFEMGWVLMSIAAIGVAIPTPGGTGSYHTLAKTALVVLFGFSQDVSMAYAVLTHGVTYIMFIVIAVIVFFVLNKHHENLLKVLDTEVEDL